MPSPVLYDLHQNALSDGQARCPTSASRQAGSCVSLRSHDHGMDSSFIWLRLTEKMRRGQALRRIVRLPLSAPPVQGHASALPDLARVGLAYLAARAQLCELVGAQQPVWLFQLPGEAAPTTRAMSAWLADVLAEERVAAPEGFAYLGHSIRAGGSSAAEAIGVPRFRGNWLGGWSLGSSVRERLYIGPSILPTPAAHALFGWLAAGVYEAGLPVWERMAGATPRDDVGEPP